MKSESSKWLEKASHSIHAAEIMLQEDIDSAAARAYYAMFYSARALLCEQGLKDFSKHSAVHAAFGEKFSKSKILNPQFHRWIIQAFDKRLKADYDVDCVLKVEDVQLVLQQALEFLDAARQYLSEKQI